MSLALSLLSRTRPLLLRVILLRAFFSASSATFLAPWQDRRAQSSPPQTRTVSHLSCTPSPSFSPPTLSPSRTFPATATLFSLHGLPYYCCLLVKIPAGRLCVSVVCTHLPMFLCFCLPRLSLSLEGP
ncbi:hypothetical protein BD414DRAFT_496042 [Trametes punicea]|nr:hypothetical protein BD414DRAFT_496042 [Trametes punicea]